MSAHPERIDQARRASMSDSAWVRQQAQQSLERLLPRLEQRLRGAVGEVEWIAYVERIEGQFTRLLHFLYSVYGGYYDFYQWDLNYENPSLCNRMLAEMLSLANQGVEILRLDAVAFILKRVGTNSQNSPEAHRVIQAFSRGETEFLDTGTKNVFGFLRTNGGSTLFVVANCSKRGGYLEARRLRQMGMRKTMVDWFVGQTIIAPRELLLGPFQLMVSSRYA